jgi:hypothetical protein
LPFFIRLFSGEGQLAMPHNGMDGPLFDVMFSYYFLYVLTTLSKVHVLSQISWPKYFFSLHSKKRKTIQVVKVPKILVKLVLNDIIPPILDIINTVNAKLERKKLQMCANFEVFLLLDPNLLCNC